VLVDAHVPRARLFSGSPLTAAIALRGAPKLVGAPWPGYRSGALAEVLAATATITNFVLLDVVTGHPFNRPAGTTGSNDTPHSQPVPTPGPATSATPTTTHVPQLDIDGNYLQHINSAACGAQFRDNIVTVTHQGNTLTVAGNITGTLNADGSFSATNGDVSYEGVFTSEGGKTVIRGTIQPCSELFVATKQ